MNDPQKFVTQLIASLILIFGGGWFMGGVLNTAALVSPQMVSIIDCPTGSTAKIDWIQQSWDKPGQKTMTVSCINQSGATVKPLSDAQSSALEYQYFYPAGVIVMAVIVAGMFIRSAVRRMKIKTSPSPA